VLAVDERGFDRASQLAEGEVDAKILAAATNVKARPQSDNCIDCGQFISAARRVAAPFAERCFDCQDDLERAQKIRRKRG
jgi:phage/conjugal plasmid C-4 type zinc finger TraR family protein